MVPIKQSLTYDQAVGEAEQKDNEKNDDIQRLEKILEKLYASHSQLSASVERYHRNQRDNEDSIHNHGSHQSSGSSRRPRSVPSK